MSAENPEFDSTVARYRSGTTARLAGVPVETLRVWERRYGVVGPRLSANGRRLYSFDEVRRLGMIKQLVDTGHAIGSIATLSTETLREMADAGKRAPLQQPPQAQTSRTDIDVVLIGPWISSRTVSELLSRSTLQVIGKCADLGKAVQELAGTKADIAVIELPILAETMVDTINEVKKACNATHAIIFYRFAPSPVLLALRAAGYEVLRKPLESVEVEWFCHALMRLSSSHGRPRTFMPATEAPPVSRFDETDLAALAETSSGIYCECPRHLVELVSSLKSFEAYSAGCASRDSKDAALHRDLQWTTGHARAALENALLRLAQAEGFNYPAINGGA